MALSARSLPQIIPGFGPLKLLSEGTATDCVVATSNRTRAPVHLDILRPEVLADPTAVKRFVEIARRCLTLQHPNLVPHLAVEPLPDGRWFLATEPGEGETLAAVLARRTLEPEELELLLTPICSALDYLHGSGLLHGDLRPENIFVSKPGTELVPRLTGFALSALNGPGQGQNRDSGGAHYVAPERIQGQMATPRSDLYSLGALIHTCSTGMPPFVGNTTAEILKEHLTSVPPQLIGAASHLNHLVQRCLAKDPVQRYASAGEVAQSLNRVNGTVVASSNPKRGASPDARLEMEGDSLGSYQLVKLLGEGSMGRVFQAKHSLLGRQVAIKILRPEQYRNEDLIQRFFQEARTVNQINHEHIVEIFDFVQERDADGPRSVYCVMELLGGMSLAKLLTAGPPLEIRRTVGIVRQLCEALAAAHKVGVVHRDVKPDNIFIIERAGQADYVKVLDFGVAKLTSPVGDAPVISTMDGAIIGTPTCMSPEQAAGLTVDHRSDIWAAGVILYEALTGKLPFDAQTFGLLAAQIITQPPPPIPERTPSGEPIPPGLKALLLRCLEKDPAKRPQSMVELREAILPFAGAAGAAAHPAKASAPSPGAASRRGGRGWAVAAVGVLAAAGIAGAVLRPPASPPPPRADPQPPPAAVAAPLPAPSPIAEPTAAAAPAIEPAVPAPKPTLAKAAPARPAGPLTMKEIAAVMARGQADIFRCFQRHRVQLKDADGQVTIVLSIDPPGKVSAARVSTAGLEASPLSECIVKEARRLRFPSHSGPPVTINVPFAYTVE